MAEEKNKYEPTTTSASADGGGKYDVEMWTYPSDLFNTGADQYGKSWVMININVQKNTAKSEAYGQGVNLSSSEKRKFNDVTDRGNSVAGVVAAGALTGAAVGAGGEVFSNSGKTLASLLNPTTRQAATADIAKAGVKGLATGVAVTAPVAIAGTASRETKRIKHAIQLPMPNNLTTGYRANWGEADTRLFDLMARAGGMLPETATQLANGKNSPILDAAASASLSMQGVVGAEGGVSAASGLAANPKKEQIFESVGFRTITLEYKFFPRDEQEAYKIYYILYQLKYHMHPEYYSSGRFTYVYPSEFDITFYNNDGNENFWVNKIATCVLTDLNVNYTPDGTWAAHVGGSPNAVQVTMTFRELSTLTKEQIDQGF